MSSFGAKRKARKIQVQDEDETDQVASPTNDQDSSADAPRKSAFTSSNKPFKKSSLRKAFVPRVEDAESTEDAQEEEGGAPLHVRPKIGRTASLKSKKPRAPASSRLSFGPGGDTGDGEDDSMILGGDEERSSTPLPKPKSSLLSRSISNRLPMRAPEREEEDEDDKPRYSKEYLSELASSTPNTPANISGLHITDDDEDSGAALDRSRYVEDAQLQTEMELDPSELEGAVVVDSGDWGGYQTVVPTDAEIREKKDRRSRLAKDPTAGDYISLDDDGDGNDTRRVGESYLSVLSSRSSGPKKKSESRLVAEDEDLGEGYDDYVEDGGISLGKKAEREARRRHRKEMADMIQLAEGNSDEESDDSEAERRVRYEAAQTRAGLEGLNKELERNGRGRDRAVAAAQSQIPPKITPLPDLSVLVGDFKAKMKRKEEELNRMRRRIEELKTEREEILRREPEVQKLLDEAGEKYRSLLPGAVPAGNGDAPGGSVTAAKNFLDQVRSQEPGTPGARGLESLGTTPTRQEGMDLT